jgi:acyl dehydratase
MMIYHGSRKSIKPDEPRRVAKPYVPVAQLKDNVGKELGRSEWLTIDQARINLFAEATGDHQFIHVDPEMAKMTPFGGTVAHGFLTLSLMAGFQQNIEAMKSSGVRMGVNYGGNKVRFLTPVRSGSRVRGRFKLLEIDEKRPGQFQQTVEYTLEIEGVDKPAVIAEWIALLFV